MYSRMNRTGLFDLGFFCIGGFVRSSLVGWCCVGSKAGIKLNSTVTINDDGSFNDYPLELG